MLRTFGIVAIAAVLAASAVVLYGHIRREGVGGMVRQLGLRQSGSAAASEDLLAAAVVLDKAHEAQKTYTRADLSRFEGLVLTYASTSAYCIQVQKRDEWYHLVGPSGIPERGPC
jgi:hypothetical protein